MRSRVKKGFWKLYDALAPEIQKQVYEAYQQFQRDPFSPGLHFEEVNKRVGLWSARVNDGIRVLGYREGNEMIWFWIGSHAEYERRKRQGH
jgi:Txe/YoeB family toxin of Txe-Axe toxin-antitoxin module